MRPWLHFLSSLVLAAVLYPLFKWKILFILAGGFLIDIDHYFWYIHKYRKLNFFECYKHYSMQFEKNNFDENMGILLVFHTIEFLLIMAVLSFYNGLVMAFTIGLLFHCLLDLIWHFYGPKRVIANHSVVWWIIRNNKIQKV